MKFLLRKIKEFINWVLGLFQRSSGVAIYEVLAITPGRNRAWVNTSIGVIKKPNGSIPSKFLDEFGGYDRERYMRFISQRLWLQPNN
jgi:hypothetical protein